MPPGYFLLCSDTLSPTVPEITLPLVTSILLYIAAETTSSTNVPEPDDLTF